MIRRHVTALALVLPAFASCGSEGVTITATLALPTKDVLSPYHPSARLAFVRITADGSERLDDVSADLAVDGRSVTFEGFPEERGVRVRAEGYDALGNLVAYGQVDADVTSDDLELTIPFRRALAYVTHRDICDGGCADGLVCANPGEGHRCVTPAPDACGNSCDASANEVCARLAPAGPACMRPFGGQGRGAHVVYAIDIVSKTLVEVVELPSPGAFAVNITSKGGDGAWVTLAEPGKSTAVFLSAADHTWSQPVALPAGTELVFGAVGTKYAVGAGGGHLVVIDETALRVVRDVPLGGRILDGAIGGNGLKAMIVTSAGLAQLDLEVPEEANPISPGDVSGASGIAISDDSRFAYVTSGDDGRVFVFDLIAGGSLVQDEPFLSPVRGLTFSGHAQILLGIQVAAPSQRVFAYSLDDARSFPLEDGIGILPEARSVASGPLGRRVVVVSAGTSTGTSGLTVITPVPDEPPAGSTVLYLRDPTDTYLEGRVSFSQRYRPDRIAILYGQ